MKLKKINAIKISLIKYNTVRTVQQICSKEALDKIRWKFTFHKAAQCSPTDTGAGTFPKVVRLRPESRPEGPSGWGLGRGTQPLPTS